MVTKVLLQIFRIFPKVRQRAANQFGGKTIPYKSTRERHADAAVHIVGTVFAVLAATGMLGVAILHFHIPTLIPLVIYCGGLIATFVASARYNMAHDPVKRARLRRYDLSAIYVMIAGTYTPLALIGLGGPWGIALTVANWAIAFLGIWLSFNRPNLNEWVSLTLYMVQSWLVVVAFYPVQASFTPMATGLIIVGGIIYTAGVIFHRRDDWPFNKAIWHGFVVAAAATHYVAILNVANIV